VWRNVAREEEYLIFVPLKVKVKNLVMVADPISQFPFILIDHAVTLV
jgi:hypothetical protein